MSRSCSSGVSPSARTSNSVSSSAAIAALCPTWRTAMPRTRMVAHGRLGHGAQAPPRDAAAQPAHAGLGERLGLVAAPVGDRLDDSALARDPLEHRVVRRIL